MQFSSDEKHQVSLQLLREVQIYLDSHVPPHPLHYRMARRIESHLKQPTQKLVTQAQKVREGWCLASFVPLMEANLVEDELTLRIPIDTVDIVLNELDNRTVLEEAVSRLLGDGLKMKLRLSDQYGPN